MWFEIEVIVRITKQLQFSICSIEGICYSYDIWIDLLHPSTVISDSLFHSKHLHHREHTRFLHTHYVAYCWCSVLWFLLNNFICCKLFGGVCVCVCVRVIFFSCFSGYLWITTTKTSGTPQPNHVYRNLIIFQLWFIVCDN